MCGISGFFHPKRDFTKEQGFYESVLTSMNRAQKRRGPDDQGISLSEHFGLGHVRLSIVDLLTGRQPIEKTRNGHTWGIVYNGELYNTEELRKDLERKGHCFETASDTEVILSAYLEYGPDFVRLLNGIFAFAITDPVKNCLMLCRDRAGVKPLFYTSTDDHVVFSSEIKGLFCFPGLKPQLDKRGFNEIFSIGPARTSGQGIFKDIREVLPGHYLLCSGSGIHEECYW